MVSTQESLRHHLGVSSILVNVFKEVLNKVYRNKILWLFGNGKVLEKSIELVILRFGSHISNIELTELLYISIEARPGITIANEFQCFILTKVASKNVIGIISENKYAEITSRWYIDSAIETKKTVEVYRPSAICRDVFCSSKVT